MKYWSSPIFHFLSNIMDAVHKVKLMTLSLKNQIFELLGHMTDPDMFYEDGSSSYGYGESSNKQKGYV